MATNRDDAKNRRRMHAMLAEIANSDTCAAYCRCIICRVRRIVRLEQDRTQEGMYRESAAKRTKLVDWRGGLIEFAKREGPEVKPPWYGVEISGSMWNGIWYAWLDYCGPPQLFLTRKNAVLRAAEIREQYKCKARVVEIAPIAQEKGV